MLYYAYEFAHLMVSPYRTAAHLAQQALKNPCNPLSYTMAGKAMAAACDLFENTTRRYGKPTWRLHSTELPNGTHVEVKERIVHSRSFCDLLYFDRHMPDNTDPNVLIVAPMSGHYATLLRGTVEAMLPEHNVYITDWQDASEVPLSEGKFDLEDYIEYVIDFLHFIGKNTHVIAVCQPGPPVLAAVSIMSAENDPFVPATMTYMGSPIDPRKSPTVPNKLATEKPIEWFEQNVISAVPFNHDGYMRMVYPGFLQLTGFMTMNLERHYNAHVDLFHQLVKGDGDSVEKHYEFYDEYLAVMDLTAEFYLQTIKTVFQENALPKGKMRYKGRKVKPEAITRTALLTIEGERDDISGVGQTRAALAICKGIPDDRKESYLQEKVGHYGVFNGSRWKHEIQPKIRNFIRQFPEAL